MLKITNTAVTEDDAVTITEYDVKGSIVLNGDSMWDYNYERYGDTVRVSKITVVEDNEEGLVNVSVEHEGNWRVYTDTGFEQAISEVLGFAVRFTEQGMQDDEFASLEAA